MGRSIIYGDDVESNISTILEKKLEHIGLIIGQRTIQKDIAIRLCPVSQNEESEEETDIPVPVEQKNKKSPNPKKLEINEAWLCQFAKEVTRMLSGGIDILGLYVVAPSSIASNLQAKLRLALYAVFKTLNRDQELALNSNITDKIILHVCTVSLKCTCRTYDISDIRSTPNPAEWKYQSKPTVWQGLQSQVAIDLKYAVRSSDIEFSTKKQIDLSLATFLNNIQNSVPTIDNEFRDPEEILDASAEGKKSKQKKSSRDDKKSDENQHQLKNYRVDLLIPLAPIKDIIKSDTFEGGMMLTLKGTIQCRAFVHSKATVLEAIQALKQDVVRSIIAHCEIHCQVLLLIEEEQQDPVVVYELPKRVFAPLPVSNILVSDYQFHGNTAADSLEAFKELLNLELNEEDIETTWETSPGTSALIQPEVAEDRLSEFGVNQAPKRNVIFQVAGAAIAAVAAGLSYLLLVHET